MNNARLASNMSVWEMIADNKWRWPVVWNLKYHILANIKVPMLNSQKNDKTKWKDIKGNLIDYKSKAAWEVINCQATEVNWNKVVWFSQCNPRMAFIMWMDIRRRLQTQDKVMAWSNDQNMKCPLCKMVNVSRNHLFFECDYSREIQGHLKKKMDNNWLSSNWDVLVDQYANNICNNSIGSILMRIILAVSVYHIGRKGMTSYSIMNRLMRRPC
nr:hypothetical protein [Tanacetum cinerariifolium]